MATYRFATVPSTGEKITFEGGRLHVPATPIIPFIEGDGTGPDIWRASQAVFDGAVAMAWTAIDAATDASLRERLLAGPEPRT